MAATTSAREGGPAGRRLLLFARVPQRGEGMPVVAAKLGTEAAYLLQSALFARTLEEASRVASERWLIPTGGSPVEDTFLGWEVFPPGPEPIATRLSEGFRLAFEHGGKTVVAIDMECPALTSAMLDFAFHELESGATLVLGPSERGGYYLLGMSRPVLNVFDRVPFGSSGLLRTTLDRALEAGVAPVLLPRLTNVEDVPDWEAAAERGWLPPVPKRKAPGPRAGTP